MMTEGSLKELLSRAARQRTCGTMRRTSSARRSARMTDLSLCIGSRLRNRLAVLSQVLCLEPAERPLQPFRRFPGYDPEIHAHGTESCAAVCNIP